MKAPALPPHHFVRAAEPRRHALIMGQLVDDRPDRELALHMKRGLEFAGREQVSIDAAQALRFDVDEQPCAAFATGEAWISLQSPRRRVAADDLDSVCRIDGFRRIGAPVHRLAVVAMAIELHDRLSADFDRDRAAAALDFGHSLCSGFFFKPRLPRLSPKPFFS
jgi:hypothetical protein